MSKQLVLLLILTGEMAPLLGKNYFCDLKCERGRHTVCFFEPCRMTAKNCGTIYEMVPLNKIESNQMLWKHNEARTYVSQEGSFTHLLPSSDMNVLYYSEELAFVAQCWANTCWSFGEHDQCRSTSRYDSVGQNTFLSNGAEVNATNVLDYAFDFWVQEANFADQDVVDVYEEARARRAPHFLQVVAAKVTHIGCGRSKFGHSWTTYYFVVCNYGPGGLVEGEEVYKAGEVCKSCTCDRQYVYLCARHEEYEKFKAPFVLNRNALSEFSRGSGARSSPVLVGLFINIFKKFT